MRILVICFSLLMFSLPGYANKQRAWPIATFTCDKEKNEVKIKNEVKWGDAGRKFPFQKEQGTYNPWELVEIIQREGQKLIVEKDQLNLRCELKEASYRFIVRPKIFNQDPKGKCGDKLSVKVSIYKNDKPILESKEMESFCHGNSPILKGIKVKGGSSKVKLYEIPRSRFY